MFMKFYDLTRLRRWRIVRRFSGATQVGSARGRRLSDGRRRRGKDIKRGRSPAHWLSADDLIAENVRWIAETAINAP